MAAKTKKKNARRKFSAQHIVKRQGHTEPFDERKIYASVYEASHAVGLNTPHAEKIASGVSTQLKKWIEKKEKVNARELHKEVVKALKKHHADVAFMYEWHKEIC